MHLFKMTFLIKVLLGLQIAFNFFAHSHEIDDYLLPQDHVLTDRLNYLCADSSLFDRMENLLKAGFKVVNSPENFQPWSIVVLTHPSIPGYVIKKYMGRFNKEDQLKNYLARVKGARLIAEYIQLKELQHIVVPQKWIYALPAAFGKKEAEEGAGRDYILVCEKIAVLPGGYWEGPTKYLYAHMPKPIMEELCMILYDLCGCDAWPQNQPFTRPNQIAFIDTEHLGMSYGDFLNPLLPFINPALHGDAIRLWEKFVKTALPWMMTRENQVLESKPAH